LGSSERKVHQVSQSVQCFVVSRNWIVANHYVIYESTHVIHVIPNDAEVLEEGADLITVGLADIGVEVKVTLSYIRGLNSMRKLVP
jgi:hypothetical protein